MNAETFRKIKYGEWQKFVSESAARRYHAKNIAALKEAQNYHDRKTRPLEVLVLHGSGRSSARSCAQEYSNSQLFLRGAIEHLRNDKNINITEKALRDFNIEPCNSCFLDPNVEVYGLKKWRKIGEIKKHRGIYPIVLNKEGKFAQIVGVPRPTYSGTAYSVTYEILGKQYTVEVTHDHQFFLSNNEPIRAENITTHHKLKWIGLQCEECNQPFQLEHTGSGSHTYMFCSLNCRHKAVGRREGARRRGKTLMLNHEGKYRHFEAQVVKIESRPVTNVKTYCLTMDGDPSFVINGGLASHNCLSTASTWCHMPCSCFVFDPMQELYPLVIKCDVMLVSTGVNQSAMSSRLKLFADRLISLDGGFYLSEKDFQMKTPEFKDRMVALERDLAEKNALVYDARMWGRVAAYFIASKDEENTMETIAKTEKSPLGYIEMTAWPLYDGFADYGFFHVKQNWYAGTTANWREPMSSDKAAHNADVRGMEKAKAVVNAAIELAQKFRRDSYPEFDGGARPRTRT